MAKRFPINFEPFLSIRLIIITLLTCLLALPLTVTVFAEGGISYGETRDDYLDADDGDHDDTWTFFGRYGDEVIITARDIKGDWTLDTYLELYAPYGWRIAVDDNGASTGRGRDARLRFCCLQEDGEYRIVVSYAPGSSNNFGSYALTLEREASSGIEEQTCALQPRLQIGERTKNITDTLTRLRRGPSLRESRVGAIAAGEVVDVLDGPVFAYGYYWWQVQKASTIGWTAESGDCEYWLEPYGRGAASGSTLTYGDIALGILNDADFFDDYKFEARADEYVTITMNRTNGNLDPAIRLYDVSAVEVAYDDNSGTGNAALISDFRIPEDAEYTIHALRNRAGQSGTYELSLTLSEVPAEQAKPIACGQTVTGEITDDDWRDFWHIEGLAGHTVRISLWGAVLQSTIVLSDTGGYVLGRSQGIGDAYLEHSLEDDATYTIEATRSGGETGTSKGSYSLFLDCDLPTGQDTALPQSTIAVGDAEQYCLESEYDLDEFQLRLAEPSNTISVRVSADTKFMVPGLTLWNDSGGELATDTNVESVNIAELNEVELGAGVYIASAWSVRGYGCFTMEIVEGALNPTEAHVVAFPPSRTDIPDWFLDTASDIITIGSFTFDPSADYPYHKYLTEQSVIEILALVNDSNVDLFTYGAKKIIEFAADNLIVKPACWLMKYLADDIADLVLLYGFEVGFGLGGSLSGAIAGSLSSTGITAFMPPSMVASLPTGAGAGAILGWKTGTAVGFAVGKNLYLANKLIEESVDDGTKLVEELSAGYLDVEYDPVDIVSELTFGTTIKEECTDLLRSKVQQITQSSVEAEKVAQLLTDVSAIIAEQIADDLLYIIEDTEARIPEYLCREGLLGQLTFENQRLAGVEQLEQLGVPEDLSLLLNELSFLGTAEYLVHVYLPVFLPVYHYCGISWAGRLINR